MTKTYTRLVNYTADIRMIDGQEKEVTVNNLLVEWNPDEMSLTATEYWAACDHVAETFDFDWFSVKAWDSSPVEVENSK